ncbi:hypothetical protein ACVMIH_002509 [Bradyrhizobium sp. USDA 4503]
MPLIARKGDDNVHHFGHQASYACANAPETALHKLAKEIVSTERRLVVPEVRAEFNGKAVILHRRRLVLFDNAVEEARHLKDLVPDLYVERDGHRLLVEIYVTHACDELKRIELKNQGIAAVEIDLSRLPRDASRSEVEEAVIEKARRIWLFHPKIDSELKAMRARHLAKEDARRRKFENEVADCLRRYDVGLNELVGRKVKPFDQGGEFFRMGLGSHIGCAVGGAGAFRVTEREWQYRVLRTFLPADAKRSSYRHLAIFEWLKKRGLIRAVFDYVHPDLEDAARKRNDQFRSPYRAIEAYLDELVDRGVLQKIRAYSLSTSVFERLLGLRASDQRKESRRTDLFERINKILAVLPDHERSEFSIDAWLTLPQEGGLSFGSAIEADDDNFDKMIATLRKIEAMMFRKGPSVLQTLHLPVDREQERQMNARQLEAEAKEQKKAEALRIAAEERGERLRSNATAHGDEWAAWIGTEHPHLRGMTPLATAISGEDGVLQALRLLRDEVDKRAREWAKVREIEGWRSALEAEVSTILGGAAHPFLNSPYPLGSSGRKFRPRDYCVSKATFAECVDLARNVLKRRR